MMRAFAGDRNQQIREGNGQCREMRWRVSAKNSIGNGPINRFAFKGKTMLVRGFPSSRRMEPDRMRRSGTYCCQHHEHAKDDETVE